MVKQGACIEYLRVSKAAPAEVPVTQVLCSKIRTEIMGHSTITIKWASGHGGLSPRRGMACIEGGWTTKRVFLPKQLQVREGKNKVLATWIRDVITHDLCRRDPSINILDQVCARALMSARSRWLFAVVACFGCFKFF